MEVNLFHWTMSTLLYSAYAIQSWQLKGPQYNYSAFSLQRRHLWRVLRRQNTTPHTQYTNKDRGLEQVLLLQGTHSTHTHREWLESKWWGSSGWLTSRRMDNVKCKFMGAVFYLWIKRESIQTHRSSQHFPLKTFSLCVSAQRFGSESKTGIQSVEKLKDPAPG